MNAVSADPHTAVRYFTQEDFSPIYATNGVTYFYYLLANDSEN